MTRLGYVGGDPSRHIDAALSVQTFDDLQDRLDEVDAVVLTSRPSTADALKAAKAKKHLLIEKPFAQSSEKLRALLQTCRENGVLLMPNLPMRFLPSIQVVHESLTSGKVGKPGLVRIHHWASTAFPPVQDTVALSELDLALWMYQCLPSHVYALRGSERHTLQVHLGFPDRGLSLLAIPALLHYESVYCALSLIGSKGAAYNDDHHNMQLLYRDERTPRALKTAEGRGHFRRMTLEFIKAIEQNREPSPNGEDALRALQVVEAVNESIRSNGAMLLQGDHYEQV